MLSNFLFRVFVKSKHLRPLASVVKIPAPALPDVKLNPLPLKSDNAGPVPGYDLVFAGSIQKYNHSCTIGAVP